MLKLYNSIEPIHVLIGLSLRGVFIAVRKAVGFKVKKESVKPTNVRITDTYMEYQL